MRSFVTVALFALVAGLVAVAEPAALVAQDKKDDKKKQPKVDPKTFIPDAETLKAIKDKTEELRKAVAALKAKKLPDDVLIEVEIYLKAAENIVRFEEWLAAASVKWAQQTLDLGLARAKQAEGGKAVWRDAPGKWVLRAYRSTIDGSIQPYAVLLPPDYGKDPKKKWRLDIVLHGRDGALTESKFIATHQGNAPKDLGYVQLEPYGRGNNAYRWAGETDVFEAASTFRESSKRIDRDRHVLRGFSMGGAGTWHIGLRHPDRFCVIGPGAGFTTTHGYIGNLPKELPDYQEKCLRIYDALGYAENAFNVPIVAYSGEKDAQKLAADNIENALKRFKEPHKFTHLIAPGLAHAMPKEWQDKAEIEYRKYVEKGRDRSPERVRLVTYTGGDCEWVKIRALDAMYEKAIVDARRDDRSFTVKTTNVRVLALFASSSPSPFTVTIDGQQVKLTDRAGENRLGAVIEKADGKWIEAKDLTDRQKKRPQKIGWFTGPIDDAFKDEFVVVGSDGAGWHAAAHKQFASVWDRYFRAALPTASPSTYDPKKRDETHLILFGDPQSNPLIAKVLPKLPIKWTTDELVVNGVKYDPKTHVPVLIYPNPLTENQSYVVINSGHTFKEADLKGTNALLYPRLGDWAVIKPTPTDKDPAAYEVVAAGLFDENWQFPKKK
ncbi:MAG: hypothetical protein FJ304_19080 [Planctomycetes bacterium]|nr:hypothetical protein [Planctomycetota bacterium]